MAPPEPVLAHHSDGMKIIDDLVVVYHGAARHRFDRGPSGHPQRNGIFLRDGDDPIETDANGPAGLREQPIAVVAEALGWGAGDQQVKKVQQKLKELVSTGRLIEATLPGTHNRPSMIVFDVTSDGWSKGQSSGCGYIARR
jgi:hypothetical protein